MKISLAFFTALLLLTGCDRVKQKANELKEQAVDNVFRPFDAGTPDTDHNKKRFTEFFGFTAGSDVDSLYCFGDEMGADSKYMFAFRCDPATAARICDSLDIVTGKEKPELDNLLTVPQPWWPDSLLTPETAVFHLGDKRVYHYWWYFPETRWAYYHTFDM